MAPLMPMLNQSTLSARPGNKFRREHSAEGNGLGRFRRQIGIAARDVAHQRTGLNQCGEYIGRGTPCDSADAANGGISGIGSGGARIHHIGEVQGLTTKQFTHIGRTDSALVLAAERNIVVHLPVAAQRIGPDATNAREVIIRIAESAVQAEALDHRHVLHDRDAKLAKGFPRRFCCPWWARPH